ncbi:VOC family protein [Glycomyces paridis]|uniref:VOC family protein n=1 Tax=Glycomyces paridis TaxID=2126555 RepID=A0A4S8PAM9_9ACTN|nr:VOC family protein [Glycomyces paridis]THV27333.1 VOC family protein [Glycomyces paridis]
MTTTIPMLPCGSIDETTEFYLTLGFERTVHQMRPNPYIVLARDDWQLHFFGLDGFDPEQNYSTCLVIVDDTGALWKEFAAGMRAAHGKVLVSGYPRMTRPRKRGNTGNRAGFSLTDPSGNVLRFFPNDEDDTKAKAPESRLGRTLVKAVILGDSKGDVPQAIKILDATLAKAGDEAPPTELVEALVYRTELALREGDGTRAAELLDRIGAIELSEQERAVVQEALASAADLARQLADDGDLG